MSVSSSGGNAQSNARASAAAKGQAEQAAQTQREAQQKAQQQAATQRVLNPTSRGFDTQGNRLNDQGKIVQFANRQAQESYLSSRGVGNTGQIVNQGLYDKADFSNLYNPNANTKSQASSISPQINPSQKSSEIIASFRNTETNQLQRGSAFEDQLKQSEAEKASKIYGSFSNQDYFSGGKKDSDKTVVSLGKAQAFFGKTESGNYGWGDIGKTQLVRNSKQEEQVKQSEAEKAFANIKPTSNASYITGGTPDKTFGGVQTKQSAGKSMGWSVLAPEQLSRGSSKEQQVKQNEVIKAEAFVKDTSKQGYDTTLVGLTDKNANKGTTSLAFLSRGKPLTEDQVQEKNSQIALGNGLISLSNQQIAAKNISSDKEFRDYLHKGTEQGAVFSFFVGDKKVGETSGARSYHDYLSVRQKYGNNVSVGENFPSREKTLSEAVKKNTAFYSGLSQPYWDALSKAGFFSEKNQAKINEQINLYGKVQSREALASGQGILPAIRFGGEIPVGGGRTKIIGPEQNEVASFMKFPFAGQKTSTSFLKSTSYSDILQFYPGIPGLGKALAPAGEVWINLIGKGQNKFGEIKTGLGNKVRTGIGERAVEGIGNIPKPKPSEPSLEPRVGRNEPTFRPTNPTRERLPSNILSKDTAFGETPVSARPNTPRNTFFEDITKDTQGTLSKAQNDLLTAKTPTNNPPASKNIPFYKGRLDQFGRLFTGNQSPITPATVQVNEAANVSGLASSVSPIRTTTDTSTTGLSPTSSQFFGVQFQGPYPTSYLPTAAGQLGSSGTRVVQPDIFYTPAKRTRNIDLGFGEQPKESVSATPDLIGGRKNLVKENQSIFLSRTQSELLVPIKKSEIKIIEQRPPEEVNILGRRGKPPVKGSSPLDITQTPRSEFVERGRVRSENEVFTNRGQKIKNEYGDVLFGNLPKPQGALRTGTKVQKPSKPVIDLEPQKEYQDWRFQKRSSEGPFNYGFRIGKPPKEVNLGERKDYQDWRFAKFLEKNPQPEKVGSERFQSFVDKNLPKVNKKAPVYSSVFKETKGKTFKSSSAKLFETKPKEEKKGTEFKNTGSKQETVLLQKPLARRRIISSQEQQYESGYEFKPIPTSKSDTSLTSGIISGLKSGTLSGLMTGSKLGSSSLLGNLNKNLTGIKPKSSNRQSPKQTGRLFISQIEKQTPKQSPRFFQSPKQNTSAKQAQKQTPKTPTPQVPRTSLIPKQTQPSIFPRENINKNPKPKPILPTLFGPVGRKPSGKSKNGPTGLYQLSVKNIFASSLDIEVPRNRRVLF